MHIKGGLVPPSRQNTPPFMVSVKHKKRGFQMTSSIFWHLPDPFTPVYLLALYAIVLIEQIFHQIP
jgi:hypothetical protein